MMDSNSWEQYKTFAGWLLMVGLPSVLASLVVGLSYFPRLAGSKRVVLRVLDALSLVTFKDSPKSLKLPLVQMSGPPLLSSAIPRPKPPMEADQTVITKTQTLGSATNPTTSTPVIKKP